MFFDDPGQIPDISANRSSWEGRGRVNLVGQSQDTFVGTAIGRDVRDHQGSSMQTALVFRALKILPPQVPYNAIVPPQKVNNNEIKSPGAYNLTPNSRGIGDVEGRHQVEGRRRRFITRTLALCDIDRYHDKAAYYAEKDEDVAAHFCKAKEDCGVQADCLNQLRFPCVDHRFDPGEEALAHRGRSVFEVRMLDFGRIDKRMTRSDKGEEEGE